MPSTLKTRRRIWLLFTPLCVVLAIGGGTLLFVKREVRHQKLNGQLIDAIQDRDYKVALALLDQGATGDARLKEAPPVTLESLFESWLHRKQIQAEYPNDNPCALILMYRGGLAGDLAPAGMETLSIALITHGSPLEATGDPEESLLRGALYYGHHRAVAALLNAGVPPDAGPSSSLLACGDVRDAALMLHHGANPNLTDPWDGLALASVDLQIVKLLLKRGANVNARDAAGNTALMQACRLDRLETVRALLAAGADVKHTDEFGSNAAMLASGEQDVELMQVLAEFGADFTLKSPEGNALNFAAEAKGPEPIMWLLEAWPKTYPIKR